MLDTGTGDTSDGLDTGRFGRLLALIAAVTAVSLLTSAQVLPGSVSPIAVGAVAVVTAITGFLIALGASYDESEADWAGEVDRHQRAEADERS